MLRIVRRFVALLVFLACAVTAHAQSYTYSIYVDADTNAGTGCVVSTPAGPIPGIESVLAVTVTAGTPPAVSSVTRSSCNSGSMGAPVPEGNGSVTVGAGLGGTTSIEVSDTLASIAPSLPSAVQLYAVAQSGSGSDVLLTTTGAASGQPIVLAAAAGTTVATPLFGIPAALLLVTVLLALGSRAVRRRMIKRLMLGLVLLSGVASAASLFNWSGFNPLANDPAGDTSSGEANIDLRHLFGAINGGNVFLRLDINSNLNTPPPKPVAVADTYQATINTPLNVAAPGVLANDTLNGGTIISHTNVSHGTLTFNNDGSFVYTPAAGFTGSDQFTYTLNNAGGNAVGNVNIVVLNGPAAQPDTYTTIVGTPLTVAAPGVLANDNLGNPTSTLQSFGGGSMGGTVTTNTPGAAVALGASGGTLTLNANGSLSMTAPTTAGTYTFSYRIGNVKGTSDGLVTIQVNQHPTITSVSPATFVVGTNSTYTITTTGTPTVSSITLTGCTLPTGLSFSYTSGSTATISGNASVGGTVSCTVTASNGVSPNATQTLVVNANAGPVAQPDNYTTTVGTPLNVSATGVLSNDTLGVPAATMSSFGGGSTGGSVTSNVPGAGVALGASGGTLTLNANGSLSLTAPTTAGTYTFLYRIGNVQGTSDGLVTIQVNQAPAITSASPATFAVGTSSTYTITTTGTPTVTSITLTGCVLPAGLSFSYTSGSTATISGNASAGGTVSCTVTASNGVNPDATQTLVVDANAGPVAQPDNYSTKVGTALVVSAPGVLSNDTLGVPTATLTSFGGGDLGGSVTTNTPGTGVALAGGTLTLQADGSFNLTAPSTAGTYTFLYRIGNVQGTSDGTVTIQVNQAPAITSLGPANFSVGTSSTYNITTTGTPTVTSITLTGCVLPAGLSFSYTSGSGATISGNATATGSVVCTVTADNGITPQATQSLTVNSNAGPVAVSDSYTTVVGTGLSVSAPGVLTNDTLGFPQATLTKFGGGSLGGNVTDNNAGASVALTGSGGTLTVNADGSIALTAPTTAGTYTFQYRITNSQGSSDGTVTIQVNQAPSILSPNNVTFLFGTAQTFTITTSGTPTVNSITLTGCVLPAGLSFNYASGATATISGTPTADGNVSCTVTADNGIAPAATQTLAVAVNQGPAAVADTYSTLSNNTLTVNAASGLLANDTLGNPAATLTSFGANSLGGVVTDHAAGATVSLAGGNLTVNADGSLTLTTPTQPGQYTFQYRITNTVSTADAMVTINVNQAPAITSAASTAFVAGQANTFGVTTTGFPNSTLSIGTITPALAGVNFVDNGNGTATLSGNPALGTAGSYTFTITAHNGIGSDATQNFTLQVNEKPIITSGATTTFTVGTLGTFTVQTTGTPTASIARGGVGLPGGVNFVDNGNGTGTLSGTPNPGTGGSYAITFTATNTAGSSPTQNFTLVINEAPAITSLNTTTFTVGSAGTFTITTTGNPTAAINETGSLPGGVNFTDNGNGTATLAGTPNAGTGGSYPITINASNGVGSTATQSFTLVVHEAPAITSVNTITFTAGVSGTNFTVTTTGTPTPSIARTGVALPAGVTFTDNGNGTGTLVNNPAAGTGGTYAITFTASNGVGSNAVQSFTLVVNQAPAITSLNNASFLIGQAGQTFTVNTTGFPTGASMVITQTANPDNLPANVTFTNNGNGTATIAGTPAPNTAGAYSVKINANNGVAPPASQNFTFTVTCPVISLLPATSTTFTANYNDAAYSQAFTPSGGTSPYTYTVVGSLPNVAFSGNNLAGTPNNTGSFPFTVKATDSNGCSSPVQSYTLNVKPVASDDTYPETVLGNVSLNSSLIPFGTTTNDSYPSGTGSISTFDATSANGGTVSMTTSGAGLGQFTYNPAAGFNGTDTFTYTLSSHGQTATATVHITVVGMIWFINNTAGAGDGRLSTPFNSLAAFQAINNGTGTHPAANQSIFLYDSATGYTGPVTLLNGQKLIGQDATSGLAAIAGVTPGASNAALPATGGGSPNKVSITATGNTVTLGSGNTVWGMTLGNATGTALTGASVGSLKIRDFTINTTGAAVSLANGALDAIIKSISAAGGTHGISLSTTTGSFDVEGDGASDPANTTRGRTTAKNGGGTLTLGSGGTIQSATGVGVLLSSATNVTLRNMVIQNNGSGVKTGFDGINVTNGSSLLLDNTLVTGHAGNNGLHATGLAGLTMEHDEIHDNATNSGVSGGTEAWNVRLDEVTGTVLIDNTRLYNSYARVMGTQNHNSTPMTLTVTNSLFDGGASNNGSSLLTEAYNTAAVTLSFTGSTANNGFNGEGVGSNYNNSSTGSFTVKNSAFDHNGFANGGGADIAVASSIGNVTFDIENNTTRQIAPVGVEQSGTSISADLSGQSTVSSLLQGKILNNIVGKAGVLNSGSTNGAAIAIQANGLGTITTAISTNTIRESGAQGIAVLGSGGTGAAGSPGSTINVTVQSNDVLLNATNVNGYDALDLTAGGQGSMDVMCAHVSGNTRFSTNANPNAVASIVAEVLGNSTLNLQGYGGAANDAVAIPNYLDTTATTVSPASTAAILSGTIKAAPSACPTPP
jgi:hypothetical protein